MIFVCLSGYVLCKMPCGRIKQTVKRCALVNVPFSVFQSAFFAML